MVFCGVNVSEDTFPCPWRRRAPHRGCASCDVLQMTSGKNCLRLEVFFRASKASSGTCKTISLICSNIELIVMYIFAFRLTKMAGRWSRPGSATKAPCGLLRHPFSSLRITAPHRSPAAGCLCDVELLPPVFCRRKALQKARWMEAEALGGPCL